MIFPIKIGIILSFTFMSGLHPRLQLRTFSDRFKKGEILSRRSDLEKKTMTIFVNGRCLAIGLEKQTSLFLDQ